MRYRRRHIVALAVAALFASACRDGTAPTPATQPSVAMGIDDEEYCNPTQEQCAGYPPPTDPAPNAAGIYVQRWSMQSCSEQLNPDIDHDGVNDYCENALAASFAPLLRVGVDCNWDDRYARPGGEYLYAVQRGTVEGVQTVRIAYLPAYYKDCGYEVWEPIPLVPDGPPHSGDSEFIIIDAHYDPATAHWLTDMVFLSAHCGATKLGFATDPDCQWWGTDVFSWVAGKSRGAPIVWASIQKHANYYSQSRCNTGTYNTEDCNANVYGARFPVEYSWQNVGSADHPTELYIPLRFGSKETIPPSLANLDRNAREAVWATNIGFNGWQDRVWGGGSTALGWILYTFGFRPGTSFVDRSPSAVANIVVTPSSTRIVIGDWRQYSARAYNVNGEEITGVDFTWGTTQTSVAEVHSTGMVGGLAPGQADIIARIGNVLGQAVVNVESNAITSMRIDPSPLQVRTNESLFLTVNAYNATGLPVNGTRAWRVLDGSVASITAGGTITGLRSGMTTVIASVNGIETSAPVTVTAPPIVTVRVNEGVTAEIPLGGTWGLGARAYDAAGNVLLGRVSASTVTWSIDDPAVASIDFVRPDGIVYVTAHSYGTTTIRATVEGITGIVAIIVIEPPPPEECQECEPSRRTK